MGQFQKGIRPDMDKNVIRRGEIVSDSGKLYSVIGITFLFRVNRRRFFVNFD